MYYFHYILTTLWPRDGYEVLWPRNQKFRQFLRSRTQSGPIIQKNLSNVQGPSVSLIRCLSEEALINPMRAHGRERKEWQLSPM